MYLPQGFMTFGSYVLKLLGNRTKGAVSGWLPTDIANLSLWLKTDNSTEVAEDIVDIYIDTGQGATAIGAWQDNSADSRGALLSSVGQEPTYQINVINSLATARWHDPASQADEFYITCANCLEPNYEFTCSVVFKVTADGADQKTTILGSCDKDKSLESGSYGFGTLNVSGSNYVYFHADSSGIYDQHHYGDDALASDTFYVVTYGVKDVGSGNYNYVAWVNSTAQTLTEVGGGDNEGVWGGSILNKDVLCVGNLYLSTPSQHFEGDIAEIVFYKTFLSDSNRAALESYLATKFDITLS